MFGMEVLGAVSGNVQYLVVPSLAPFLLLYVRVQCHKVFGHGTLFASFRLAPD